MRYVAVSRPDTTVQIEILGVGETMDEAYAGARAWFDNAFDKFGDLRWNELVAMQNNLNAVPEAVLYDRTGVTLDEWLAHLASVGQSPGTPQTPKPPPKSPTVTKVRSGWEPSVWVLAIVFVAFHPCYRLVSAIRGDLRDGDLSTNISLLAIFFILSLTLSVAWAAFWFWVVRIFKDDATLQDYLLFLFILQFASFVAGRAFLGLSLMGIAVY
jgi:hypothetical protein